MEFFFFLVLADKSLYNTDTDKIFLNNAVDIINLFFAFFGTSEIRISK